MRAVRLCREESGSTLVEFGICASILLLLMCGVMDFSRALYVDHFLANAANEATRYAMVRGATFAGTSCTTVTTMNCDATAANVVAYVQSLAPAGMPVTNMSVNPTWTGYTASGASCAGGFSNGSNSPGCVVTVKLSYNFNFSVPILPHGTFVLTSTSVSSIQQ